MEQLGQSTTPADSQVQPASASAATDKKEISIFDAIQIYMKQKAEQGQPFKIVIGTPCYGGMVHLGYFQSINDLTINFTKLAIPFEICTIGSESLIPRARNGIVARFMADEKASHLMFIDADITFSWVSVIKLVLMNKDLSGGCYPKKMINWDKVKANIEKEKEIKEDALMAKSLDYVFNPVYQTQQIDGQVKLTAQINNGMIKVKDIGTGFMMIKKECFEILMYKHADLKYRNNVAGYHTEKAAEYFYTLFDTDIDPESRVYLSEDYLFCKRWVDCGGECWLDLSVSLNHTGVMDFRGCVAMSINTFDTLNKDYQITNMQASANKELKAPAPST